MTAIGRVLVAVVVLGAGCRTVVHHPGEGASAGSGGAGGGAGGVGGGGAGGGVGGSGGAGDGGSRDSSVADAGSDGAGEAGVSVPPAFRRRLAASGQSACALGSDGTAWCWGAQSASPVALAVAGTGAVDIGDSNGAVCLIKGEGSVYCGAILDGIGGPAVALSLGGLARQTFGCAIRADGAVFCWAAADPYDNPLGPLSAGGTAARAPGLDDAVDIACGGKVACALRRDGTLWCWGGGSGNIVSMSPDTGRTVETPRMVPELGSDVEAVFAGSGGVCARKPGGDVWCWGGLFGAPGGYIVNPPSFQPDARLTGARRIAIGGLHACAIGADSTVACFGDNRSGQLGDGTFVAHTAPAPVVGLGGPVAEVVTGDDFTCAMLANGAVRCFGDDSAGQLGDGSALGLRASAVDLGGSPVLSHRAPGGIGSAVLADGSVRVWGQITSNGVIAAGPLIAARPIALTTPSTAPPAQKASVGDRGACILTTAGAVSCLSGAVVAGATVPLAVAPSFASGVEDLSGACAVRSDGYGACNLPTGWPTSKLPTASAGMFKKIDAGLFEGCAILRDGRLVCWMSRPASAVPVEQVGGSAIDVSGWCAVRADGAVLCVTGSDSIGLTPQLVPLPAPCVGVTAGSAHTCAWTADGRLYCWGANDSGQLGDGTVTVRDGPVQATVAPGPVRAASAGTAQTCVELAADGSLWCWGWNGSGELGDGKGGPRALPTAVAVP